ncbi:MAG: MFS transporter [Actinobacteria bacterium]|nr:MFS transporter [Actinomycetota bacterium]MBU1609328.1 MFS transporter [Actinomycetota bacterium]MBU2314960.1 MFS transporter [Actinomycetota bacterium]MBU2385074.1 MFS transporter [Actinomycetota bacterium]
MRAPITVMGPLLGDAAGYLGDLSVAALLVSLPLLAFSIAAPAYPLVLRRVGLSRSLQIALGVLAAGLALRQFPGAGLLLGGTIVVGAGIAALNVAMPVVVKARWPSRVGLVTGVHTSVTALAAATAAAGALPLAELVGWRAAMATVGATVVLAGGLAAMMTFALSEGPRASKAAASGRPAASPPARPARAGWAFLHPTIRWLSALMALQAGTYYALVSWLPTILLEAGRSAAQVSGLQGVFVILGVVSGPLTGFWLQSGLSRRALAVASTLPLAAALVGLALAPAAAPLWVVLAGLACGASFTLTLALFALKSTAHAVTAHVSSVAQSIGYVAAALVPVVIAALAERAGSWVLALLVLAALALAQSAVAVGAVGSREVGERQPGRVTPAPPPSRA